MTIRIFFEHYHTQIYYTINKHLTTETLWTFVCALLKTKIAQKKSFFPELKDHCFTITQNKMNLLELLEAEKV